MYSGGYSQVSKYSLEAKKKMQQRPKGKSCGYYMRIIFFFSSLIQSLIIVSLVLFLVYGKKQDSASSGRIQDLEQSFSRLSLDNLALRQQRKNLTNLLNSTLTENIRNEWDLSRLRIMTNISIIVIRELNTKWNQCTMEKTRLCPVIPGALGCPKPPYTMCNNDCQTQLKHLNELNRFCQNNLTQTTTTMAMEIDQIAKERDNINLEAIELRKDKDQLQRQLQYLATKCEHDFTHSLSGITNFTRAFLGKIESLFPQHIPFQLTCQKQREYLEQIRNNCTSLSREVEDKFQRYLDNLGSRVLQIQSESSYLLATNLRLSADNLWCSKNRTGLILAHKQNLLKAQLRYDEDKKRLLVDKKKLSGEKALLESKVGLKDSEISLLKSQINQLNVSCQAKRGFISTGSTLGSTGNRVNVGASNYPSGFGIPGSNSGFNLSGLVLNKLTQTGIGSTGSRFGSVIKPGTNSIGSSSFGLNSLGPMGTDVGKKPASFGLGTGGGSTGLGSTRLGVRTGLVSSNLGIGSSAGSSSGGLGNTGVVGAGSLGLGGNMGTKPLGSGVTGGLGTIVGAGFGKLGLSSTGRGSTGLGSSVLGRGTTVGGSLGGGGFNLGSVNILQHLQELQRLANPSSSEKKQDPFRALD